jgi:hypothetical protein
MGATRSSQAPWHWPRGAESAQSLLRGEARPLPLAGAFHPRRPSWGRCVAGRSSRLCLVRSFARTNFRPRPGRDSRTGRGLNPFRGSAGLLLRVRWCEPRAHPTVRPSSRPQARSRVFRSWSSSAASPSVAANFVRAALRSRTARTRITPYGWFSTPCMPPMAVSRSVKSSAIRPPPPSFRQGSGCTLRVE